MSPKTYTNQSISQVTDSSKGQKIAAALYLITNHLDAHDPVRMALRTCATSLFRSNNDHAMVVLEITNLLETARFARIVTEQNVAILTRELGRYMHQETSATNELTALFSVPEVSYVPKVMSYKTPVSEDKKYQIKSDSKNKRQEQILSFINTRKSAGIKDISALFPEVSEKTIQRELGALVDSGKITKRGSKRWSIYLAVSV